MHHVQHIQYIDLSISGNFHIKNEKSEKGGDLGYFLGWFGPIGSTMFVVIVCCYWQLQATFWSRWLKTDKMPRKYKHVMGSTRRKQYSDSNLKKAVDAVAAGMSQREAAQTFGIPRVTLQHKVTKKHTLSMGGQPVLTDNEEKVIAHNVATMGDWGFPVDALDLRMLVKRYLEERGRTVRKFPNNLPGKDWVQSFLHRQHEIISPRMCRNICRKRAEITPDNVGAYFDNLTVTLAGVPPSNIINYDETNLTDDPGQKKCMYRRGCKYPERVLNSTKASTSMMFAGTASGELLYPYVVYKAEHSHGSLKYIPICKILHTTTRHIYTLSEEYIRK
jgi:hypothetical protein